ncbi:universal stress protein [Planomonospora corallina]|uniref:Universal stress protein n=1 Tax=Planomonospora corallina TaxID=1806052 RepID=A0ABV8I7U6_9ACTN
MTEQRGVVVGYDGSDFSMQALDWAMDECELRRSPLTVTHAWRWPYGDAPEEARLHLRKAADHVLYHGAECARSCSAVGAVTADLYEGSASGRLVELSEGADVVVVGSRGLGSLARSVVGSVTAHVAAHARAPVVVVRGPGPIPVPAEPGPVVLGLDPAAPDEVVEFAFREAALRRLRLAAVHAAGPEPMRPPAAEPVPGSGGAEPGAGGGGTAGGAVRERMEERLAPWRERYPDVPVETRVVAGPARETLEDASAGAVLLVVSAGGSRRPGRLGTVAREMIEGSRCPVAVVPVPADERPGSRQEADEGVREGHTVPSRHDG